MGGLVEWADGWSRRFVAWEIIENNSLRVGWEREIVY